MRMETVGCTLCHSHSHESLLSGKDRMHGLQGEFLVVRCQQCGLVFTNPRPVKNDIGQYYPTEYKGHQGTYALFPEPRNRIGKIRNVLKKSVIEYYYGYHPRDLPGWKRLIAHVILFPAYLYFKQAFARIPAFVAGGSLLEIGCSNGSYLDAMRCLGWEVCGVELSSEAARHARDRYRLDVITGDLLDAHVETGRFDIVVLWWVLEHLSNPLETLREVWRILKPGGKLIIGVPNYSSLESKVFKSYWLELDLPRHLYHFTRKTLFTLIEKNNFKVVSTQYLHSATSSIRSLEYLKMEISSPAIRTILGIVSSKNKLYLETLGCVGVILRMLRCSNRLAVTAVKP